MATATTTDARRSFSDAELLKMVRVLRREQGFPPTVREIAYQLGTSAPTVHKHLRRLRDERRVTWTEGLPRTLRVVSKTNAGH